MQNVEELAYKRKRKIIKTRNLERNKYKNEQRMKIIVNCRFQVKKIYTKYIF